MIRDNLLWSATISRQALQPITMPLLRYLISKSKTITLAIALAGVVGGLCSAALIATINTLLHSTSAVSGLAILGLISLGVGKVLAGAVSKWLMAKFALTTFLELTVDLSRKIMTVPLHLLERTGTHRIFTALTTDTNVLVAAAQAMPGLAVNFAVVIGCGGYLLWLYPMGFSALSIAVLLGVGVYKFIHTTAFKAVFAQRVERDRLVRHYRSLVDGIKELKMNRARGAEFLEDRVDSTVREVRRLNLIARLRFVFLDAWNQILFYLMIAGILFLFPRDELGSTEVLSGYIFAALYVMAPIWSIIGSIPTFMSGQVSLGKLEELGVLLDADQGEHDFLPDPARNVELELSNVEFRYETGGTVDRYPFVLGPINLTVTPGQILFIVGGNGSGKSTLVKLLSGLYSPIKGGIRLGGRTIDEANRDWYRQHISTVFSDFYLFDGLLGEAHDVDDRSNSILKELELDHKVEVTDRMFSTIELSQGQRKRLAMLTSLIEDRPINIFDEWAADQDPHYKEIFYSKLLPRLKAEGKTIIVITHDDRYFHLGDRVIKLEDGRVAEDKRALRGA